MLSVMGWRVIPTLLRLLVVPRTERKVPPWVLSTVVLIRLRAMLERMDRRFAMLDEVRSAPRGSVDWTRYATRHLSRAQLLSVPCRFPDLRDDWDLKAAIRFTLQRQLEELERQRTAGSFVLRLIDLCQALLLKVRDTLPRRPAAGSISSWYRGALRTEIFRDGLQAIEWTVDERGLAGLSDLQGLPWAMSMEEFFEAWAEVVFARVAHRIGGTLRTGRQRQTLVPIDWQPPYLGSQKYLLPDLILERGEQTIIVDAKYKQHWEELNEERWSDLSEQLRESHRADLLQVLAYANLATTSQVIVCLAYPCAPAMWDSLQRNGRAFHRASLRSGDRRIEILLAALPMRVETQTLVDALATELQS
jgi:hypothetical protein